MATFKVTNNVSKELKDYKEKITKEVIRLVVFHTNDLEYKSTRSAPRFVTLNSKYTDKGLTGSVGVEGGTSDIAAYFEFGTGLSAQSILAPYPQWIKDIAWEFYKNGQGTLTGKPYLYNNYLVIKENFERDLKKLLG